jgi:hypothetical protein
LPLRSTFRSRIETQGAALTFRLTIDSARAQLLGQGLSAANR